MVWLNLTMLFCILWSSNSCESNTQIGRNPVFLNSLFCTCIPILFLSISYPCIVRILKFKQALTQLHLLQICVKENLVWFCPAPAALCSTPAQLLQRRKGSPQQGSALQTVFRRLRSSSPPPVATTTASTSSTEQMTLRTTRVRKRGRLFRVCLCYASLNRQYLDG